MLVILLFLKKYAVETMNVCYCSPGPNILWVADILKKKKKKHYVSSKNYYGKGVSKYSSEGFLLLPSFSFHTHTLPLRGVNACTSGKEEIGPLNFEETACK